MEILKAIILGIVEGITEFLPVSSTGHLILLNQVVSFEESFTKKFDVIIQLGAILAVVFFFREKLFPAREELGTHFFQSPTFELWKKVLIGVIPALIFGAFFYEIIEEKLFNPLTVSLALLIGGLILILLERFRGSLKTESLASLSYQTALFIGLIQCMALIPGTSRSAATIIGAMILGCSRMVAVEFSFFLAIPTMIAATSYSLFKMGFSISSGELSVLLIGFSVSFLVAWIVIAGFMGFIAKKSFLVFGYYRIIIGVLIIAYYLF
ncbi:undecaprenyl-diphosphate phosphatase [Mariniphaga sediminis]|uniref:undecaprenyl-diphosphate phosphatase n=1 Tax=Mariniphaga sediminis TaxID=1628158 RepID=UPI0035672DD7